MEERIKDESLFARRQAWMVDGVQPAVSSQTRCYFPVKSRAKKKQQRLFSAGVMTFTLLASGKA